MEMTKWSFGYRNDLYISVVFNIYSFSYFEYS